MDIELWIDNGKFFDNSVAPGSHYIMHEFAAEDDTEHVFKMVLKNKGNQHTTVDDHGKIIADSMINISDISFDEILVDSIVYNLSEYIHTGNGEETISVHKFYGNLGCNGTVRMSFRTPVYLWLLENM